MEEDIKILIGFRNYNKFYKEDEKLTITIDLDLKTELDKAIENLINRNKELEEFKKQVEEIENTNFIKYKNYIPKSKVKETIEERRERLIKGKRSYTNKIRINELNLISKKLLED